MAAVNQQHTLVIERAASTYSADVPDVAGAYWALLSPTVSLRRVPYDLNAAAARIRASGYPWADDFVGRHLRHAPTAAEVAAFIVRLERLAAEHAQRANGS